MESLTPQSLLPGTNMSHGHGMDYLLAKETSKFENRMRKLMRNVPPSKRINKYYPIKLSDHSKSSSKKLVPKVSKVIIDLKSEKSSDLQTVLKNFKKITAVREKGSQSREKQKSVRNHSKLSTLRQRWTRAEDELLAKAMSKNKFQKGKRPHETWIAIKIEMDMHGQSDRKIKEIRERARYLNLDPRFFY